MFEIGLERSFPEIPWREPVHIAAPNGEGFACRFCIAKHGIRASRIPMLPQSRYEFRIHMMLFHAVPIVTNGAKNGS